jgi:predicted DCC family thiol-disulfide oxidoreductase YuxK
VIEQDVLIFDAECPYCTVAASTLRTIDNLQLIGWDDPVAQRFLEAQFDDVPFAMVLIEADQGQLHLGRAAAARLAMRAGSPALMGTLVRTQYDRIAETVSRLSGRSRPVDAVGGNYALTAEATACVDELIRAAGPDEPTAQ